MIDVSDLVFQQLIDEALQNLPGEHAKGISNIAILYEDEPTQFQRQKLALRHDQTLLGLYEGVPLPQRQGNIHLYPDKITLFKLPLQTRSNDLSQLKELIRHTLWHEIAHYYGLDHNRISELE